MADYKENWEKCISLIREKYGEKHKRWFGVWYKGVEFGSYDPTERKLTLRVPDKYVYYYLETDGAAIYREAVRTAFPDAENLSYFIVPQKPSFQQIADYQQQGNRDIRRIHIDNARQRLEEGLRYFLKGKPVKWLKGYDRIADWLTDNKGKGLLVFGTPGLGKSLICQRVLPILIGCGKEIKSVSASQIHDRLDELKQERIVIIDDLGKEQRLYYGNKDQSFYELCNHAERTGALLIITTNLATGPVEGHPLPPEYSDSIQDRYGSEVLSRLKGITKTAQIVGEDMRSK